MARDSFCQLSPGYRRGPRDGNDLAMGTALFGRVIRSKE